MGTFVGLAALPLFYETGDAAVLRGKRGAAIGLLDKSRSTADEHQGAMDRCGIGRYDIAMLA